ncbi:MAG: RHS repeat-associated core domain-containing protein, partial [Thermoanaerobaculia bacterium]|nr:RHS repeat-associated core domain-containing protein [Thermoanaerobaculia bacterium]
CRRLPPLPGRRVGHPGQPGTATWNVALGRYWSHSYAERIVEQPGNIAWLLTRFATFERFQDANSDGFYETVSPGDEYRSLEKLGGGGFELRALDGTIDRFNTSGQWTEREDRHGNTKLATYTSGALTRVDFPDGRHEDFTYHGTGKLASITEVGVDGTTTRVWLYTWSGNDLVQIDRPDGTALEYLYGDVAHPGFLTRITLVGTDASERIDTAFAYDAEGNVVTTWRGTASSSDPAVVDKWTLAFDDPDLPTETTVTDPLGQVSLYTLETRTHRGQKPRLSQLSGSCPTCGLGPNSQITYGDPAHPYRPTQEVDGDGTVTVMAYDGNGQMTSRIEAFGTALERETIFEYDATYPAFATEVVQPSVTGNPLDERRTSTLYDAAGNAISRTIEGHEAGSTFSLSTTAAYNTAGTQTLVDPPGFGTADQTLSSYDATRGDLVILSRTAPVVGTTTFGHDAFNRRTSTIDPNGVETTTSYDPLDRVIETAMLGAVPAEDLVTQQVYNVFGDLVRTILPRGNVVEYGYDAAGRLISMERRPDTTSRGERTLYTLDALGHRIQEQLQSWNGSSWVTQTSTQSLYSSRCHLDKIVYADGSSTEFAYDCDGNLIREWDANHPSASQTAPATRVYGRDALERITSITEPWGGAGGGTVVTSYGYDVQDHLVSVTDGEGNTTTYEHSDRDLLTEETSPVSGLTSYTYDSHGSLTSITDARAVTMSRSYDAADRVTFVDYPDPALDTTYVYDDVGVPFSKGRLTAITRNAQTIDYAYDRFGRTTQDGDLGYGYDPNGNRVTLAYPGGVVATYTFDFADREATLSVDDGVATQGVVSAASYLPFGPLSGLTLGNAVTETRLFTNRYFPGSIEVQTARSHLWDYATDAVGNITAIDETEECLPTLDLANLTLSSNASFAACDAISAGPDVIITSGANVSFQAGQQIGLGTGFAVAVGSTFSAAIGAVAPVVSNRSFAYQDVQYFLGSATGAPWGSLAWTYDKIGNRLSEDRNSSVDTYTYVSNGTGNTAILSQAGARTYTTGPAGHVTAINASGNLINLAIDDAGRLAGFERPLAAAETSFTYDGRSLLRRSEELLGGGPAIGFTEPTYNSLGALQGLHRQLAPSAPEERISMFSFAGRPVAQLRQEIGGPASWLFFSTDHLGTPVLATDLLGEESWHGPFEPFGDDPYRGSAGSALAQGVYLRFPGQWEDETWDEASLGAQSYYNVYRWYAPGTGRYWRSDPIGLKAGPHLYAYAQASPLNHLDFLGLVAWECANYELSAGGDITAGVFYAACESECVNNRRVRSTYLTGGVGIGVTVGSEISYWNVADSSATPDPLNLQGFFGVRNCSVTPVIGLSTSTVILGQASGDWSLGPSVGWGVGCFAVVGASKLLDSELECCDLDPNQPSIRRR